MKEPSKAESVPDAFEGSNFTFHAPPGMEKEVGSLPCYRQPGMTISCWKFGILSRLRFLCTGRIFLWLMSDTHPPVAVATIAPQFEDSK